MSDIKLIEALATIPVSGATITDTKYFFSNLPENTEELLAIEAIEDAKRKAKSLCAELGMKLGKILNIEDTSSGCCMDLEDSPTMNVQKTYKVNVTFELLDK